MNNYINETLSMYGATLDENGYILRNNKTLGIKIVEKGNRIRFESNDKLIGSGPKTSKSICKFVESFWFWKSNIK